MWKSHRLGSTRDGVAEASNCTQTGRTQRYRSQKKSIGTRWGEVGRNDRRGGPQKMYTLRLKPDNGQLTPETRSLRGTSRHEDLASQTIRAADYRANSPAARPAARASGSVAMSCGSAEWSNNHASVGTQCAAGTCARTRIACRSVGKSLKHNGPVIAQ